jgi:hypothetical protein
MPEQMPRHFQLTFKTDNSVFYHVREIDILNPQISAIQSKHYNKCSVITRREIQTQAAVSKGQVYKKNIRTALHIPRKDGMFQFRPAFNISCTNYLDMIRDIMTWEGRRPFILLVQI